MQQSLKNRIHGCIKAVRQQAKVLGLFLFLFTTIRQLEWLVLMQSIQ